MDEYLVQAWPSLFIAGRAGRRRRATKREEDGLYLYRGGLVAVQNANPSPERVVRLFLSAEGRMAERAQVLESNHPDYALPMTGVIVGDDLFYVANTQIDSMGAGGQLHPGAALRDLILLRLRLN